MRERSLFGGRSLFYAALASGCRHCEPTGPREASPMTGSAKQSRIVQAQTVWFASELTLLANTLGRDNGKSGGGSGDRQGAMPVRRGGVRDRRAGTLGLA